MNEYVSATGTLRYYCPLSTCAWQHDVPTALRRVLVRDGDVSAGIAAAIAARNTEIEAVLTEHTDTHTTEEWVREVLSLQRQVAQFEAQPMGIRPHRRGKSVISA